MFGWMLKEQTQDFDWFGTKTYFDSTPPLYLQQENRILYRLIINHKFDNHSEHLIANIMALLNKTF